MTREYLGLICQLKYGDAVTIASDKVNGIHIQKWEVLNEPEPTDLDQFYLDNMYLVDILRGQQVREKRNAELRQSDFVGLVDVPILVAEKTEWLGYRQELRDITKQPGFPNDVVWPTKPKDLTRGDLNEPK